MASNIQNETSRINEENKIGPPKVSFYFILFLLWPSLFKAIDLIACVFIN